MTGANLIGVVFSTFFWGASTSIAGSSCVVIARRAGLAGRIQPGVKDWTSGEL